MIDKQKRFKRFVESFGDEIWTKRILKSKMAAEYFYKKENEYPVFYTWEDLKFLAAIEEILER